MIGQYECGSLTVTSPAFWNFPTIDSVMQDHTMDSRRNGTIAS